MAGLVYDKTITTGHELWPPTTVNADHNDKVYTGGKLAVTDGDPVDIHMEIIPDHEAHASNVVASSTKVFIKGKAAARIGDSTSCGDTLAQSSNKVFINE